MSEHHCDRPPTNAEMFYKIIHEWLNFWWKFILLIFKNKFHSTLFVSAISCGILFFTAHLTLADCLEGAKWLITLI